MPARTQMAMLHRVAYFFHVRLLCPIVGGEVAQPPRAIALLFPGL